MYKINKKILKEDVKVISDEEASELLANAAAAGAAPAPAGAATAGAAPATAAAAAGTLRATSRANTARLHRKFFSDPKYGIVPESPLKSGTDLDKLIAYINTLDEENERYNIAEEKLQNNILYYVSQNEYLHKVTIDADDDGNYIKISDQVLPGGMLKGFHSRMPFQGDEESGVFVTGTPNPQPNTNRANRIVYINDDNILKVVVYNTSGFPTVYKPDDNIYYTKEPNLGTFRIVGFVPQTNGTATLTIRGAKETQSGENILEYSPGPAPAAGTSAAGTGTSGGSIFGDISRGISNFFQSRQPQTPTQESKQIYGKILKEVNFLLQEKPTVAGAGASASAGTGGSANPTRTRRSSGGARRQAPKQALLLSQQIAVLLGMPSDSSYAAIEERYKLFKKRFIEAPDFNLLDLQKPLSFLKSYEDAVLAFNQQNKYNPSQPQPAPAVEKKALNRMNINQMPPELKSKLHSVINNQVFAVSRIAGRWQAEFVGAGDTINIEMISDPDLIQQLNQRAIQIGTPANMQESWSIRNKNKYANNLFERLIKDVNT